MESFPAIPEQSVIQFFEELDQLDDADISSLVEQMGNEQHVLFTFLLTIGDSFFNDEENELLLYLGLGIWYNFNRYYGPTSSVSLEQLEEVQDQNQFWLEQWTEGSEAAFYEELTSVDHLQPDLLHYLVEIVLDESSGEMNPDHQGLMLIYAKIVLESLAIHYLTPIKHEEERPHQGTSR